MWKKLVPGVLLAIALPVAANAGVKGDLNDDGVVNIADAMLLSRVLNGDLDPATLDPEDVADVGPVLSGIGGDDELNVIDLLVMLRALEGPDLDTDGLTTPGENAISTSPFLADTEGDGWIDPDDPDPLVFSAPGVPETLRVFDGPTDVQLTWAPPQGETDHYVLHRYGTDGSYEFLVVDAGATSYLDTNVQSGVVYRYWLESVNSQGQQGPFVNCSVSDPENETLWLTGAIGDYPNPWFTATAVGTTVTLTWEASPSPEIDEYHIYSSDTPVQLGETAGLTLIEIVDSPTLTHDVTGLSPMTTYYFRIIAVNSSTGMQSNLASAKQVAVAVN